MDLGAIVRAALVVCAFAALVAIWTIFLPIHMPLAILGDAPERFLEHAGFGLGIAIITFNVQAILRFVKRSLTKTDELVIGSWYIYRYTKAQGETEPLVDLWKVRRNFSNKYVVSTKAINRKRKTAASGKVVCNERDRFSILIEGHDHKEQSLVCFSPRIPAFEDSRMLGLGVGDDADYVLSARIYLASRFPLPDAHYKCILDDASKVLRCTSQQQLIQLPAHLISEVFMRNHLSPELKSEVLQQSGGRLRNWLQIAKANIGSWWT